MSKRDSYTKEVIEMMQMAKSDQNKNCAECGAPCPLWVSYTCGVFICTRCAGLHRSLGVHLSRVKSVTLDSWTPELVEIMRKRGNRISRRYFEATLPEEYPRPKDERSLVEFIKNKYQYKSYVVSKLSFEDFVASENPRGASTSKPTPPESDTTRKSSNLFEKTEVITPSPTVKNDLEDLFSEPMQTSQPVNPVGMGNSVLPDDFFSVPNLGNSNFQGMQPIQPQQTQLMDQNNFARFQGQNMPGYSNQPSNFQGQNMAGYSNQQSNFQGLNQNPMGLYSNQGQMQPNQQFYSQNQPQMFNPGVMQPQQGGNMPHYPPYGSNQQPFFGGNQQMFPQPDPQLPIKKDVDPFAGLADFQPSRNTQKDPFF